MCNYTCRDICGIFLLLILLLFNFACLLLFGHLFFVCKLRVPHHQLAIPRATTIHFLIVTFSFFFPSHRVQLSTCNDKRLLQKDLSSEIISTRSSNSSSNSSFSSSATSTSNCYSSAKDHGYSSRPSQRCKFPFDPLSPSLHLFHDTASKMLSECSSHPRSQFPGLLCCLKCRVTGKRVNVALE